MAFPPHPSLRQNISGRWRTRPLWCLQMLKTQRRSFGNIVGHAKNVSDLSSYPPGPPNSSIRSSPGKMSRRSARCGAGPLILKGILDVEDARMAARTGADAIIVSNHGGRQLDGAPSSISMLPKIVDAVGHQIEVHVDGGIRSGQDVLKAVALGAKGTYIGPPLPLRPRRRRQGRRDHGARYHPQGARHHHGALRQTDIRDINRDVIAE